MTDYSLRTPAEWAADQGVEILDTSGWTDAGVELDLPITVHEFWRYMADPDVRRAIRDWVNPPRQLRGNPPRPERLEVDGDAPGLDRGAGGDARETEGEREPSTGPDAGATSTHGTHGGRVPAPSSRTRGDRTVTAHGAYARPS